MGIKKFHSGLPSALFMLHTPKVKGVSYFLELLSLDYLVALVFVLSVPFKAGQLKLNLSEKRNFIFIFLP